MSSGERSDGSREAGRGWVGSIASALRHPVAVVILGSAFSALVLPWISARMNDRRLISDARYQRCVEILDSSREVNRRLNTMVTTLEMFIKDCREEGRVAERDRREVGLEMARQYRDFDLHAWWWLSQLRTQARLLRIGVDDETLKAMTVSYGDNVKQSTFALDRLWTECLRRAPRPNAALMATHAEETRKAMGIMQQQRDDLIGKLVRLFAPQEPTIQHLLND